MRASELSDLEIVLRTQLGPSARWRLYERDFKSPMNFVLDTAQRDLKSNVNVFWAEGAAPEAFCLNGFSEPVVVFNPRFVELWGDVRAAFVNEFLSEPLKEKAIERLCLQIMAERSLWKHDDPEFAALAILQASMAQPHIHMLPNSIETMELEPITPVYMACWFYGLTHELGHFVADVPGFCPDDVLFEIIKHRLNEFKTLPEHVKTHAISRITKADPNFILALHSVREESKADIFATSVLFESTFQIMNEIQDKEHQFRLLSFVTEMFISLNVIIVINRCERISKLASTASPGTEMVIEALLHPVLLGVRLTQVRRYLEFAALKYLYDEDGSRDDQEKISRAFDSVMEHLRPYIDTMEKGMTAAIKFASKRVDKPDFFKLLEAWNTAEKNSAIVETFLAEARTQGKWAPHFETIQAKLANPSAPLDVAIEGQLYFCPCTSGPNEFNRPFHLPTRHGNLVFVFLSHSALCEKFCEISSEDLREGYKVQPTPVVAKTMSDLEKAIGKRLEADLLFTLAIEGTDFFDTCMEELSQGTIWPADDKPP